MAKDKIFIIIFVTILLLSVIFVYKYVNKELSEINESKKENIVTNKDYLYDVAAKYIKNKYYDLNIRREQNDYQVIVSYEKFGITKDKTYNYAYMWVLSESYFVKNNTLYQGRSNSSLYKMIFLNDEVVDYDMPNNGKDSENAENYVMDKNYSLVKNDNQPSDFSISLKELCHSKKIYDSIMDYKINLSNAELIKEHYSYLKDLTIAQEHLSDDNSSDESVPFPADKAHGGSGNVYRDW